MCLTMVYLLNDDLIPQHYVEGSHEAIISNQIFMKVQAEIARRAILRTDTKDKSSYFSKYAFSGIVFGEECGSPYRRLTWWTPHGKKRYVWRGAEREFQREWIIARAELYMRKF